MPSKKKDKGKTTDWLQCSLCGKLIGPGDADIHSKSCDADHGFIVGKTLHGKIVSAERQMSDAGSPLLKSIKDKDSVIWLAIPTMRICGLSIGQPCVINSVLVKRAWPLRALPLPNVTMSAQVLKDLNMKTGDTVTVEQFIPSRTIATDTVLCVEEPSDVFQTPEFCAFAASYLDGRFITEGTPLSIRYFGQICQCRVINFSYELSDSVPPEHLDVTKYPAPLEMDKSCSPANRCGADSVLGEQNLSSNAGSGDSSFSVSSQDLSDCLAALNISTSSDKSLTSTPKANDRCRIPMLVTPVKDNSFDAQGLSSPLTASFARVTSGVTRISMVLNSEEGEKLRDQKKHIVSLIDIGGLNAQIEELKSRISRAQQPGCSSRCVLLYGPSGTGKSLLVRALTTELNLHTVNVSGTDIWSKLFGEAESNLKNIFKAAQSRAPSIIVIDDLDVVCPKRSQNQTGQQEHRIVGTLLSLIDGLAATQSPDKPVIVIGITNNRDAIDPALRRAGRFGCEVEVGVPTATQRKEILEVMLRKVSHTLTCEEIEAVARNAHGYVGADLAALMNEASMHSLGSTSPADLSLSVPKLSMNDFVYAGLHVKPSALREIQLEVPQVRWTDIGGMSEVKMRLHEAVSMPLTHPEVFHKLGIEPPRGLLMYGPPGCSKTMVARALATECKLNFLAVKGPELFNQYVGESEKAIREVFRKARSAAPSIIFFDEIDAIAAKRGSSSAGSGVDDRVLTQLLTEMDGLEFLKDVFIVAATNRPDKIDRALLRPGRFDSLVYVPLPDAYTRTEILEKKLQKMHIASDVCLEFLGESTHDYSGAEIIQVCQEAALYALRENLQAQEVTAEHFRQALEKVKPQIDPHLLQIYEEFAHTTVK